MKRTFRIGQVVASTLTPDYLASYARIESADKTVKGKYQVRSYDNESGDFYLEDWHASEMRPLTAREQGKPEKRRKAQGGPQHG